MVVNVHDGIGETAEVQCDTSGLIAELRRAKLAGDRRLERRMRDALREAGIVFGSDLPVISAPEIMAD